MAPETAGYANEARNFIKPDKTSVSFSKNSLGGFFYIA
jgi:hypothetical protein